MCKLNQERFINPYHFIGLPERCKREKIRETDENLLTGKLTVEIETKTPLYIPNTSNDHAFSKIEEVHKSYDFFAYKDYKEMDGNVKKYSEPVIPGSELRGMLRSVYETLTGSCLSSIDKDEKMFRRTGEYFKTGLLWWNSALSVFYLYDVKFAVVDSNDSNEKEILESASDGKKVICKTREENKKTLAYDLRICEDEETKKDNEKYGYIIKGEKGPDMGEKTKHYYRVFLLPEIEPKTNRIRTKEVARLIEKLHIANLLFVLKTYQDDRINKNLNKEHNGYKEYLKNLRRFLEQKSDFFPVYYSKPDEKDSQTLYLSPACITKEVYFSNIKTILKHQGNFYPCEDNKNLCQACALFGMVGDNSARASIIRVADAKVQYKGKEEKKDFYINKEVTLPELSTPKISATEFYLQAPKEASFWTYDYYVKENSGDVIVDLNKCKISGRKFYWHDAEMIQKKNIVEKFENIKKEERNITVRLVKEGVVFLADIYFDKITEKQLEQLKYICNYSSDGEHGYKLGGGKSVGLGSISMRLQKVTLRSLNMVQGTIQYSEEETDINVNENYSDLGFIEEKKLQNAYKLITSFKATDGFLVTYPRTEEQRSQKLHEIESMNGFEWFVANTGGKLEGRKKMRFQDSLEPLSDDTNTLRYL